MLSSVAEINLGIVCACIPVCFPLLKGLTETLGQSASACKHYLLKRSEQLKQHSDLEGGQAYGDSSLPKIPKVNLKTLLSIFRDPNYSQREKSRGNVTVTRGTNVEMSPYTELRSVDMDYHNYLVNGHDGAHSYRTTVASSGKHSRGHMDRFSDS